MNIKVSYAELDAAAASLAAGRDEITAKLQSMQTKIQELAATGFVTDQASGKFAGAYERYSMSARTVIEQLTEIQAFLRSTAQIMQETDINIAARIQ